MRWEESTPVWGMQNPGRGHHGTTNKVGTQVGVHVVGGAFHIVSYLTYCVIYCVWVRLIGAADMTQV